MIDDASSTAPKPIAWSVLEVRGICLYFCGKNLEVSRYFINLLQPLLEAKGKVVPFSELPYYTCREGDTALKVAVCKARKIVRPLGFDIVNEYAVGYYLAPLHSNLNGDGI